ncbi:MAG: CoA-transferase [Chloroflexi bacterium]|nr:CoA-transferase [Chloroflexota bacterium]
MVVCLARLLYNGETVFHGVASPIPMAAVLVARALQAPRCVYLTLPGGVDAQPSRVVDSTVSPSVLEGARSIVTLAEIFDLSARGRLDVAFLSGVQIDRQARINLSVIGDPERPTVRLPGGAGSAALMPTARRTLLWRTKHDPRTFVEAVPFSTAAGNVERVVTPLCVFRREAGGLVVETIHSSSSAEEVRQQTGFDAGVTASTPRTPPPTEAELAVLEQVDPGHTILSEF